MRIRAADTWDNVGLDREASTGVEVDGVLAAISLVQRDGARMWSDYTASRPEHRGRGLALAAKLGCPTPGRSQRGDGRVHRQ